LPRVAAKSHTFSIFYVIETDNRDTCRNFCPRVVSQRVFIIRFRFTCRKPAKTSDIVVVISLRRKQAANRIPVAAVYPELTEQQRGHVA